MNKKMEEQFFSLKRRNLFGIIQYYIALMIGWYLLFQQTDIFSICLCTVMMLSFLFSRLNMEKSNEVLTCFKLIAYLSSFASKNKTKVELDIIEDFEKTDLYKGLVKADVFNE